MSIRHGLLIASAFALIGCHRQAVVTVPKTVTKVIQEYIAIPEDMTTPCPIALPQDRTVEEAVRIARARRASLINCNKQLDEIRKLAPSKQTDK